MANPLFQALGGNQNAVNRLFNKSLDSRTSFRETRIRKYRSF